MRVQGSDVSRNSAFRIAYHNLQHSSSLFELRDPLLKFLRKIKKAEADLRTLQFDTKQKSDNNASPRDAILDEAALP